jgi:hypothetical protein
VGFTQDDEPKGQQTKVVVSSVVRDVAVDDDNKFFCLFFFFPFVRRESGGVDVVRTESGKLQSMMRHGMLSCPSTTRRIVTTGGKTTINISSASL